MQGVMQLRSTAGQKTFQREKKKNSCQKMLSQQSYSTSKKGRISPRFGGKKKTPILMEILNFTFLSTQRKTLLQNMIVFYDIKILTFKLYW